MSAQKKTKSRDWK